VKQCALPKGPRTEQEKRGICAHNTIKSINRERNGYMEGVKHSSYTRGEISSVLCRSPTTFDSAFLVSSSAAFSRARFAVRVSFVRIRFVRFSVVRRILFRAGSASRSGCRSRPSVVERIARCATRTAVGPLTRFARVVFTVCGVIARGGPNVSAPTEVSSRRSLTVDGGRLLDAASAAGRRSRGEVDFGADGPACHGLDRAGVVTCRYGVVSGSFPYSRD
jgi:hypothetical protein